jgi:ATPase family associated with various cellular activities (AAA)
MTLSTKNALPPSEKTVQEPKRSLVVAGDISWEHHLQPVHPDRVEILKKYGGAVLLYRLIHELEGGAEADWKMPRADESATGYHIWKQIPGEKKEGQSAHEYDRFLGFQTEPGQGENGVVRQEETWPELLVLDDMALGFRHNPWSWPSAVKTNPIDPEVAKRDPMVVLKTTHPLVTENELLEHLLERFPKQLVVLFTVDDLRQMDIQIRRDLSWEQTVEDLFKQVALNRRLRLLRRCHQIVVMIGLSGAVLLEGLNQDKCRCTAVYDPTSLSARRLGAVFQEADLSRFYTAWLTASIVAAFRNSRIDLSQAIREGLSLLWHRVVGGKDDPNGTAGLSRLFLLAPEANASKKVGQKKKDAGRGGAPFETVCLVGERSASGDALEIRKDPLPSGANGSSGLELTFLQTDANELQRRAEDVVHKGPEVALRAYPHEKFGENLFTADRREIERFRAIIRLLQEFSRNQHPKRPLCLGVFGQPGTGKSFVVKELARSVYNQVHFQTFNLSQFSKPADLHGAFHQVRDSVLRNRPTVVFWDEFDSPLDGHSLGWLRYFLAPMQDGEFQEGQITHPLGKAVFVFAGGIYHQWKHFNFFEPETTGPPPPPDSKPPEMKEADWKKAKGPDFQSRLQGHLDILGPNRVGQGDDLHWIRRAILLRVNLLDREKGLSDGAELKIDPGVLNAFLYTTGYKFGARSMEALIAMSVLTGRTRFERSCLPPDDQLGMHLTDLQNFKELLNGR